MHAVTNLTPDDVVTRWKRAVTVGTLANWRAASKGPPFVKFGGKVRYRLSDLETWEAAQVRNNPSQENAHESHQLVS